MLCCLHKRLLVLPCYKWMVPVPARCAASFWKNVGWLGGLLTLSSCGIPKGKEACGMKSEKVGTPVGGRPWWKPRDHKYPPASSWLLPWENGDPTWSDASFLEEAGNPAFLCKISRFLLLLTKGDFLEHRGSQGQHICWPGALPCKGPGYSKCGPQNSSLSISWELIRNSESQLHFRPTKWECCLWTRSQVIQIHIKIGEYCAGDLIQVSTSSNNFLIMG